MQRRMNSGQAWLASKSIGILQNSLKPSWVSAKSIKILRMTPKIIQKPRETFENPALGSLQRPPEHRRRGSRGGLEIMKMMKY